LGRIELCIHLSLIEDKDRHQWLLVSKEKAARELDFVQTSLLVKRRSLSGNMTLIV
jgi:hypothetical protein